jgi:hypothetical protein
MTGLPFENIAKQEVLWRQFYFGTIPRHLPVSRTPMRKHVRKYRIYYIRRF